MKLIKFTYNTKHSGVANASENRIRIQNDLKLENWTNTKKMNFNRGKCIVLPLNSKNQMHKYRM